MRQFKEKEHTLFLQFDGGFTATTPYETILDGDELVHKDNVVNQLKIYLAARL